MKLIILTFSLGTAINELSNEKNENVSSLVRRDKRGTKFKVQTLYDIDTTTNSCDLIDQPVDGGTWICDTLDEHGQCLLKCQFGTEKSGSVECSCHTNYGFIEVFSGCMWKGEFGQCNKPTCSDLKQTEVDYIENGQQHIVKSDFWKCSNNNASGSTCHLMCAENGFETINDNSHRSCECNENGCEWSGDETVCVAPTIKTSTTSTTTSTTTTSTTTPTTTSTTTTTISTQTSMTTSTAEMGKTCGLETLLDVNGVWFCTDDEVKSGTLCELRCRAGFHSSEKKMKRTCRCTRKGICSWNHRTVECLETPPVTPPPATCSVLETTETGYWKCSSQNFEGSRCTLQCFGDFKQKQTSKRCRCSGNSCEWKGPDRLCQATIPETTEPPVDFDQVCKTTLSDSFGHWMCSEGNHVNSKCKLMCPRGYHVNVAGSSRRCRCNVKKQTCSWTSTQKQCVPDSNEISWENEKPGSIESQKCPALVTQVDKFTTSDNRLVQFEGNIVDNGRWSCTHRRNILSIVDHNIYGAKCKLICNDGFEVLPDGEVRKCRYKVKTGQLFWSGRIRLCRSREENQRILTGELSGNQKRLPVTEYSKQSETSSSLTNEKSMVNDFLSSFEPIESFNNRQKHDGIDKFEQESTQRSNDASHNGADVRTIQLNSEIYVNSFDLFQKLERFMYENGWFSVQQT